MQIHAWVLKPYSDVIVHIAYWYAIMEREANVAAGDQTAFEPKEDSFHNSAMVWSVILHSGSLYVRSDGETQSSLGPILGIQASKDKLDCIKVSCNIENRVLPRKT